MIGAALNPLARMLIDFDRRGIAVHTIFTRTNFDVVVKTATQRIIVTRSGRVEVNEIAAFDDGTIGRAAPSFAATAPQATPAETASSSARAGAVVDQAAGVGKTPAAANFSDPGDGYDSSIRHHADFERGAL